MSVLVFGWHRASNRQVDRPYPNASQQRTRPCEYKWILKVVHGHTTPLTCTEHPLGARHDLGRSKGARMPWHMVLFHGIQSPLGYSHLYGSPQHRGSVPSVWMPQRHLGEPLIWSCECREGFLVEFTSRLTPEGIRAREAKQERRTTFSEKGTACPENHR